MGSGICTALALAGYDVILKEISQKFLDAGLARISANLASRVKKGAMSKAASAAALGRVAGALTYDDFRRADMVIEAAIEKVDLKQQIFADLEKACRSDCVLSSNTSTIDLNLIAAKTRARERIVGAHFFSPAHVMPLLEIVRTEHTSPQVRVGPPLCHHRRPRVRSSCVLLIRVRSRRDALCQCFRCCGASGGSANLRASDVLGEETERNNRRPPAQVILDTLELGLKIKKTPVVVGNCTGFAVNRVFFPYTMAACLLLDLGADPYAIDKVIKGVFGMPMGPFRLSDLVRSQLDRPVPVPSSFAALPRSLVHDMFQCMRIEAMRMSRLQLRIHKAHLMQRQCIWSNT